MLDTSLLHGYIPSKAPNRAVQDLYGLLNTRTQAMLAGSAQGPCKRGSRSCGAQHGLEYGRPKDTMVDVLDCLVPGFSDLRSEPSYMSSSKGYFAPSVHNLTRHTILLCCQQPWAICWVQPS